MSDRIKVSIGATKRLGGPNSYESVRIDVGAESDCEEDGSLAREAKRNELLTESLDFLKEAIEIGLAEL
jgi:hypothetical protein